MLHWVDLIIVIIVVFSLLRGLVAGLIRSIFHLLSLVAGLLVAFRYYAPLANLVLNHMQLPEFIADVISFLILFMVTQVTVQLIGSMISVINRLKVVRLADRLGGGAAGIFLGLMFAGIILMMLTSFPLFNELEEKVDEASLAPVILDTTNRWYRGLTSLLPMELPHLSFYPEEMFKLTRQTTSQGLTREDFSQLDGAACVNCGEPVKFNGYQVNLEGSQSPKFTCSGCGRTSDGCQTFEGHHLMYGKCPEKLGGQGYRMDCGIWSNDQYIRPTEPCPVCDHE